MSLGPGLGGPTGKGFRDCGQLGKCRELVLSPQNPCFLLEDTVLSLRIHLLTGCLGRLGKAGCGDMWGTPNAASLWNLLGEASGPNP